MATYIRDSSLKIIGSIIESGDGLFLQNTQMMVIGSYRQSINKTFDGRGNYVGEGNLLMMLVGR